MQVEIERARLSSLLCLIFFNACEAGGGAANDVGTYWPVNDDSATLFASTFYGEIFRGETVAMSLLRGRKALFEHQYVDWADYIHYGNPDFVVKAANREARATAAAPAVAPPPSCCRRGAGG
jgi:hypothetical protein